MSKDLKEYDFPADLKSMDIKYLRQEAIWPPILVL